MSGSEQIWYLGIDIGGTSAKYALVSAQGEIAWRGSFATGAACGQEMFLARLFAVTEQAAAQGIAGIGISCLGVVDSQTGEILGGFGNFPALRGLNLKRRIEAAHPGLSVAICNDVKAVARGERWQGAGKNCRHFFCMAFGTGLGGCAVLDGKVLEGAFLRAGEIGYMDYRGEADHCERRLSTGYVMAAAARRLGIPSMDGIAFFAKVRQGDAACVAVLDEWTAEIARWIANIMLLFDPQKFILGGGIAPQQDLLLPRIRRALCAALPPDFQPRCAIEAAACGNDAGMLGAVSMLMGGKTHV